ncbi:ABC transporter substrate-binding protein [Amnibacterium kyonggiense]|uniref:Carbohydrate ABC transporter substrate-binding protein (CUT1 family) n=1 Tax=Amnibacterium kyonggiense TaxID=595671 RepID=A0A4R7FIM0_9MICO|nr:extracellular solute-binding protein [Amnibacterium kyonggiense]TDS76081.1 carbohydrate ABC transporter substrate-binding protein (CUT1 family) [Amnibacterium kyonggiense]
MRIAFKAGALAAVAALALTTAACSSPASTGDTDGASSDSGPVNLTYWAWAPNMDKVVDIWNKSHPDITVTVNKQDGGDAAVTKLLTAIKAGSGAPDLMQAEYQKIPTLVSAGALKDLSKLGAASTKSDFTAGAWNAVTLGSSAIYAVPQDTGPMMFYYRKDVFKKLGLKAPATWDDYAKAAEVIHKADPTQYLGTFSSGDPGWFAGLTQQAGASWWSISGQSWGVDIDSAASKKVASYWGGLVQKGVIDNDPMYTPAWNAALNDGKQVGWISAVWGPGVLAGNAGKTKGDWAAATLPQWTAGANANGNWGGSSTAVTAQSEHPQQAMQFIKWLNTDPTAVKALAQIANIYPADVHATDSALTTAPDFFSDQSDFYQVAAKASAAVQPFTYGPNVNVAYSAYTDAFAKAAQAKQQSQFLSALSSMQSTTTSDLKKSGFSVK